MQVEECRVAVLWIQDGIQLFAFTVKSRNLQGRYPLAAGGELENRLFHQIFVVAQKNTGFNRPYPVGDEPHPSGRNWLTPHDAHMLSAASFTGRSSNSCPPGETAKRAQSASTKAQVRFARAPRALPPTRRATRLVNPGTHR